MRQLLELILVPNFAVVTAVYGQNVPQAPTASQENEVADSKAERVNSALERFEQRVDELESVQFTRENATRVLSRPSRHLPSVSNNNEVAEHRYL